MKIKNIPVWVILLVLVILVGHPGLVAQASPTIGRSRTSLSQSEIDGLVYMREVEKLAHDVYLVFYAKWPLTIFSNIDSSETNHMAAIKNLLDRYGISDPARGNGVGKFTDPDIQVLYDSLIARGNTSLSEALKVGGWIEEIDILDLEEYKSTATHSDIINVYNNLISGSCNHLRAFSSTLLNKTDEVYIPQLLSPEIYQAIIDGTY